VLFDELNFIYLPLCQESLWVLSNIAAGTLEHKTLIFSGEVVPLLIDHLSAAPSEIRKEAAYTLGTSVWVPQKALTANVT
jgi:importin subunit alpha-6/7